MGHSQALYQLTLFNFPAGGLTRNVFCVKLYICVNKASDAGFKRKDRGRGRLAAAQCRAEPAGGASFHQPGSAGRILAQAAGFFRPGLPGGRWLHGSGQLGHGLGGRFAVRLHALEHHHVVQSHGHFAAQGATWLRPAATIIPEAPPLRSGRWPRWPFAPAIWPKSSGRPLP
jgi:hypothetical protein